MDTSILWRTEAAWMLAIRNCKDLAWALTREWVLSIHAAKTSTWALTQEWALARDTTVLVSLPLKCHLPMWAGGYYLLCYYILFYAYLTAGAWPFSIDFNDSNFGCNFECGTKKCTWAEDGKLLYYRA